MFCCRQFEDLVGHDTNL